MKLPEPARPPVAFLAPNSPARTAFFGEDYVAGPSPEPIVEQFTCLRPGYVHVELASGDILTVETGKGYLLPIK